MSSGDEFDDHYTTRKSKAAKSVSKSDADSTLKTTKGSRQEHSNAAVQQNGVKWVHDEAAPACHVCNTAFSLIKRRHHCRSCGNVICSSCSCFSTSTKAKSTRMCSTCYDRTDPQEEKSISNTNTATTLSKNPDRERKISKKKSKQVKKSDPLPNAEVPVKPNRLNDHIDDWFMEVNAPRASQPSTDTSNDSKVTSSAKSTWAVVGTNKSREIGKPQRFADIVFDDKPLVGSDEDLSPPSFRTAQNVPKEYHETEFSRAKYGDQHLHAYDTNIDMRDDHEDKTSWNVKPKATHQMQYHSSYIVARSVNELHVPSSNRSEISLNESRLSDAFLTDQSNSQPSERSSISYLSSTMAREVPEATYSPPAKDVEDKERSNGGGFAATIRRFFGGKENTAKETAPVNSQSPPKSTNNSHVNTQTQESNQTSGSTSDATKQSIRAPIEKNQVALNISANSTTQQTRIEELDIESWNEPPKPSLWTRGGLPPSAFENERTLRRDIVKKPQAERPFIERKDTFGDAFDGPRSIRDRKEEPTARPRSDTFEEIFQDKPKSSTFQNPYGNYGSSSTTFTDRFATEPIKATTTTGWGQVMKPQVRESPDVDFGNFVTSKDYEFDPIAGAYVAPNVNTRQPQTAIVSASNFMSTPATNGPPFVDMQAANVIVDKLSSLENELAELKALLRERRARSPHNSPRQSSATIFDEKSSEDEDTQPVRRRNTRKSQGRKEKSERKDSFSKLFDDDTTKFDTLYYTKGNDDEDDTEMPHKSRRAEKKSTSKYASRQIDFDSDTENRKIQTEFVRSTQKKENKRKEKDNIDALFQESSNVETFYNQSEGSDSDPSDRIVSSKSKRNIKEAPSNPSSSQRRKNISDNPFNSDSEGKMMEEDLPSLKGRKKASKNKSGGNEEREEIAPKKTELNRTEIDALFHGSVQDDKRVVRTGDNELDAPQDAQHFKSAKLNFDDLFGNGNDIDAGTDKVAYSSSKPQGMKSNDPIDSLFENDMSDESWGTSVKSFAILESQPPMDESKVDMNPSDRAYEEEELPSLKRHGSPQQLKSHESNKLAQNGEVDSGSSQTKEANTELLDAGDLDDKTLKSGLSSRHKSPLESPPRESNSILSLDPISADNESVASLMNEPTEFNQTYLESVFSGTLESTASTSDVFDSQLATDTTSEGTVFNKRHLFANEPDDQRNLNTSELENGSAVLESNPYSDDLFGTITPVQSNAYSEDLFGVVTQATTHDDVDSLSESNHQNKSINLTTDSLQVPVSNAIEDAFRAFDIISHKDDAMELIPSTTESTDLDDLYKTTEDDAQERDIVEASTNDVQSVDFELKPSRQNKPSVAIPTPMKRTTPVADLSGTISLGQSTPLSIPSSEPAVESIDHLNSQEYDTTWQALQEEEKQRKQNAQKRQRQLQKQKQKEQTKGDKIEKKTKKSSTKSKQS